MANNEGYARLSNGLWRNTKIRKIARKDPQALADWIMAISFCSDKLTDGRLTEDDMLFNLGFDEESIGRLVGLGLLDQDDDGWTIHGYLDLQNSKADVEKSKEDARQRKARSRRRNTETTEATQSHVTETKVTCDSRVTFNQNQNQNQNSLTPNVVRECAPVNETEQERKERELIDTWTPTEAHQGVADELAAQGRPRVDLDELATTFRLKLHAKGLEHYGYRSTLDGLDNAFFEWIRSESRQLAEGRPAHSGKPAPEPKPHTHTWACGTSSACSTAPTPPPHPTKPPAPSPTCSTTASTQTRHPRRSPTWRHRCRREAEHEGQRPRVRPRRLAAHGRIPARRHGGTSHTRRPEWSTDVSRPCRRATACRCHTWSTRPSASRSSC